MCLLVRKASFLLKVIFLALQSLNLLPVLSSSGQMVEEGMRGVYSRSLETKFLLISRSTICLVTECKFGPCVLLTGQHIQKVKTGFLLVPLCSEELQNYFLDYDLLLNMNCGT